MSCELSFLLLRDQELEVRSGSPGSRQIYLGDQIAATHCNVLPVNEAIVLLELTSPWESRIEALHAFKMAKYDDLIAGLRRDGHLTRLFALEVGATGLVATTTYDARKSLGLRGQVRFRALRNLGETAERAYCRLWSMRNDR